MKQTQFFPAPRVHQLEGLFIDQECKSILTDLLFKAIQPLQLSLFKQEISLIIDFLYFRFTVARNVALPGNLIQNLSFCNIEGLPLNRKSKILYFIFFVVGKYSLARTTTFLENKYQGRLRIVRLIEFLYKSCSFVYFIYFLNGGSPKPYHILLWLAGIYINQPKPGISRELDFELLNRTVVWETMAGVLQFILGSTAIKQLGKMFMMTSVWGSLAMEEDVGCYICRESICVMPITLEPCNHVFCYYCFKNVSYTTCPKCKIQITSQKQ